MPSLPGYGKMVSGSKDLRSRVPDLGLVAELLSYRFGEDAGIGLGLTYGKFCWIHHLIINIIEWSWNSRHAINIWKNLLSTICHHVGGINGRAKVVWDSFVGQPNELDHYPITEYTIYGKTTLFWVLCRAKQFLKVGSFQTFSRETVDMGLLWHVETVAPHLIFLDLNHCFCECKDLTF